MKKTYLLLAFIIVGAITILSTTNVNSRIVFPAPGYCGDPTSYPTPYLTCASSGCHGGVPQPVTANDLTLKIGTSINSLATFDNTFTYVPGQTYYISFNILVPGYAWGFEMTSLNPGASMAGNFIIVDDTTEHLSPPNAPLPTYISHKEANHYTNSWIYQWTAPTTDSAVTFYYAFNASDSLDFTLVNPTNGVGVPDSNIFADTIIVLASSAGIANISNNISGIQVYPNPIDGAFSLSFNVIKPGSASAMLYSVDGKLCRQLFNEKLSGGAFNRNYNIASLAPGIYLVKINMGGATITQKIVKE